LTRDSPRLNQTWIDPDQPHTRINLVTSQPVDVTSRQRDSTSIDRNTHATPSRHTITPLVLEAQSELRSWPENVTPAKVFVFVYLAARKAPIENPHRIVLVSPTTTLSRAETPAGSKALMGSVVMVFVVMPPVLAERHHRSEKGDYWNQHQESRAILSLVVSTTHSQPASVSTTALTVRTTRILSTGSKVIAHPMVAIDGGNPALGLTSSQCGPQNASGFPTRLAARRNGHIETETPRFWGEPSSTELLRRERIHWNGQDEEQSGQWEDEWPDGHQPQHTDGSDHRRGDHTRHTDFVGASSNAADETQR